MPVGVKVKIFYIPGSHPCEVVFKAAELKGIDFQMSMVIPPSQPLLMTMMFGSRTVPAMKVTGGPNGTEKVQGSRKILRALESMAPDPPLYPADAAMRERVIAAETWAEGDPQDAARRLLWVGLRRRPDLMLDFGGDAKLPLPQFALKPGLKPTIWVERKINRATDDAGREDLRKLPGFLDQIDDYIADGVIGGDTPNAADLMVLSNLWLLRGLEEVREAIDARPSGRLTRELFGEPNGTIPAGTLPAEWFTELNAARGAGAAA